MPIVENNQVSNLDTYDCVCAEKRLDWLNFFTVLGSRTTFLYFFSPNCIFKSRQADDISLSPKVSPFDSYGEPRATQRWPARSSFNSVTEQTHKAGRGDPRGAGCSPPCGAASGAAWPGSGPCCWRHPSRADPGPLRTSVPGLQESHSDRAVREKSKRQVGEGV